MISMTYNRFLGADFIRNFSQLYQWLRGVMRHPSVIQKKLRPGRGKISNNISELGLTY